MNAGLCSTNLGLVFVATLLLAGCTGAPATNTATAPKPTATSSAAPKPAPTVSAAPTPAPVVDLAVVAQMASGLSAAKYQALTAQVRSIPQKDFKTSADKLAQQWGKPVGVIAHYTCTNTTDGITTGWGISGAFYGNSTGSCGHGDSASKELTTIEANRRAVADDLSVGGYVLVYVDMTNQDAR